MNPKIRFPAIRTLLLLPAVILCASPLASAQESDVDVIAPSRITQDLISRRDLNRLLNQPPKDRNPLRRATPLPQQQPQQQLQPPNQATFRDPNIQPASWQEEETTTDSTDTAETSPQPAEAFGPKLSFQMQTMFDMLDMLIEIPIEKLQKEIAQRRTEIQESLSIDDAAKAARLEQIELAEAAAREATKNAKSREDFQNRMLSLKSVLEQLRQQSKKEAEPLSIDASLPVDSMQAMLRELQAELDHANTQAGKISDRIQNRDDRMAGIPTERHLSRTQVEEFHEEFLKRQATGTEDIEVLLALRAKELAASSNVQLLDEEFSWHDQSQEKLPLEKTIIQQKIQRLEQEVNAWNMAIANRKRSELEEQIRLAKQKAFDTHADLKEFSQETTKLAEDRAVLAEKIAALQNEKLKVGKQAGEVQRQFESLDTSIRTAGKDESSELLIEVHRNLIRPYEGMARIQKMASEKKLTRGTILKLRNEQERVADSETFIREQLKIEKDQKIADTTLINMAEEAIETHNQQLIALAGDYEEYQGLLGDLLLARENLLKDIEATRKLVDTHALWIQSADPFSVELIAKSGQGAKEFFDYEQWSDLGTSIVSRVKHRPYECVVGMLGLMTAFVVGRKFKG